MNDFKAYSNDVHDYDLLHPYRLKRADSAEFLNAWVVYRAINEDFSQGFTSQMAELVGVPVCFWVYEQDRRVAGVIMMPNRLGDFFLIPPTADPQPIVMAIMALLVHWSDPEKAVSASEILSDHLSAFRAAGFDLDESRQWMIRPTAFQTIETMTPWQRAEVDVTQSSAIAQLLWEAFKGGIGQYGQRELSDHAKSVENYFSKFQSDSTCGRASSVIYDSATNQMRGVCLVERHKDIPSIRFVAVHPTAQRQGIGGTLMRFAIDRLATEEAWVKLGVTIGNPAIRLYEHLGFKSGPPLHYLSRRDFLLR